MQHYIEYSNTNYSDRIFISYKGKEVTFSDFYYNVSVKSRALINLDLVNQDKIGIFVSNPIDILELYFSCIQLNKTPLIIPHDIIKYDFQKIIDKYKINFIITDWSKKQDIQSIRTTFFYNQELSSGYGGCGDIEFDKNIHNINNIQSLHLTSGTTGAPKLIQLSFKNFISSTSQWHEQINFSESDRYIQCLPLNHIAGLSIIIRSQFKGFETILMDQFNSKKINAEIDNGATFISLIPSMLKKVLDKRSGRSFPNSFRGVIIGGQSCPNSIMQEALSASVPVYKSYGMTETCSGISGFWIQDYPDLLDSSGRRFSKTKINVSNSNISIKGPSVTPYNHDGTATKDSIQTSDMGYIKKGFIFITGRSDDIVISGGENISLSRIENILISHPDIENNYLSLNDENKIIAYIQVNSNKQLDSKEILSYCKKHLPKYHIPHEIQIVDEINHD